MRHVVHGTAENAARVVVSTLRVLVVVLREEDFLPVLDY
jgi:hypothetical protein